MTPENPENKTEKQESLSLLRLVMQEIFLFAALLQYK